MAWGPQANQQLHHQPGDLRLAAQQVDADTPLPLELAQHEDHPHGDHGEHPEARARQ